MTGYSTEQRVLMYSMIATSDPSNSRNKNDTDGDDNKKYTIRLYEKFLLELTTMTEEHPVVTSSKLSIADL